MTDDQARAHVDKCLRFFKDEKALIHRGMRDEEFWAMNRGADAAPYLLEQLVTAYQRIATLLEDRAKGFQNE